MDLAAAAYLNDRFVLLQHDAADAEATSNCFGVVGEVKYFKLAGFPGKTTELASDSRSERMDDSPSR